MNNTGPAPNLACCGCGMLVSVALFGGVVLVAFPFVGFWAIIIPVFMLVLAGTVGVLGVLFLGK